MKSILAPMLRFGISSASETLHENLPMAHANCDLYITPDIQENRDMTVIDTSTSSYLGVNKMNSCTKQHIGESKHMKRKWPTSIFVVLDKLIPGSPFIGQNVHPLSPSSKTFMKMTEHS